jgi:hypothetical protein
MEPTRLTYHVIISPGRAAHLARSAATIKEKAMRRKRWVFAYSVFFALALGLSPSAGADQKAGANNEVPKEVRALEGAYTGSWTMYGIDEKGEVVKRMAWTDTMKAVSPEVKGDRALVNTIDEMMFEGGQIPPFKVQGKEGYFLKNDGGLGDYFIETSGQTNRMVKVGENVWSYSTPAAAQELRRLGFPDDASGQHVLVKVVTREQGTETHRISRLTTVNWKDKDGKERALQFVSLQGYHKRQL